MKQHITETQWKELSNHQREKLLAWVMKMSECKDGLGLWYPLSIGQMIEFIQDRNENWRLDSAVTGSDVSNCCDNLWEAVKEVLSKE